MFLRTPSNVLSAVLLFFIFVAPVRGMFIQPVGESVAWVQGKHRVQGDIVDVNPGSATSGLTLANVLIDDAAKVDRVLVTVPRYPSSKIGDRVSVTCDLHQAEPIEGFDYKTYLAIRDVYAVCLTDEAPLVVGTASPTLRLALTQLREHLSRRIATILPEPESTLLIGLLLGRADFSQAWRDNFLVTGTTHIVAASGFNVSLVVITLFGLLTWLGLRRQRAYWLLLVGIASYAILAGLEPAVVRAGVMGALVLTSQQVGRMSSMRNIVLLAVAVMLAFEPRLLLHDVGFQLSVVSTAALIWLSPHVSARLTWVPTDLELRDILASTLSATFVTLPIVILSFGQVSLIGPVVNLLVLPFVPLAMSLGIFGLVASIFGTALGVLFMLPAWSLLSAVLFIIESISALGVTAIALPCAARYTLALLSAVLVIVVCHRVIKKSSSRSS